MRACKLGSFCYKLYRLEFSADYVYPFGLYEVSFTI